MNYILGLLIFLAVVFIWSLFFRYKKLDLIQKETNQVLHANEKMLDTLNNHIEMFHTYYLDAIAKRRQEAEQLSKENKELQIKLQDAQDEIKIHVETIAELSKELKQVRCDVENCVMREPKDEY